MATLCTVGSLPLDVDTVAHLLQEHNFPPHRWRLLATGLKQANVVPTIDADHKDVDGKLQALIAHWVANDPEKSWKKLVEAVKRSKEAVIAQKLAKAVGVPYPGA